VNFDLYAKVPESIINEDSPEVLYHYCQIYMLEIKHRKYSLSKYAKQKNYSYVTCRRLQKIAKQMLNKNK